MQTKETTQGMTQLKANSKFDMKVFRRRAKKTLRKKYRKTIKLSKVDKIWKEYCKYAVIKPLIKNGVAQLDNMTKLEIVGRQIVNHSKAIGIMSTGRVVAGELKKPIGFRPLHRADFIYKIKLTDPTYKGGKLIFKPDRELSRAVHEALVNTTKYYRIEA